MAQTEIEIIVFFLHWRQSVAVRFYGENCKLSKLFRCFVVKFVSIFQSITFTLFLQSNPFLPFSHFVNHKHYRDFTRNSVSRSEKLFSYHIKNNNAGLLRINNDERNLQWNQNERSLPNDGRSICVLYRAKRTKNKNCRWGGYMRWEKRPSHHC